ncbi:DeoR family transcriptional regulator [Glaciihabitans tibetensis]|uniref:DeoR family transcriptional regulator n=1 Tax=Glaciihabitans tibetensis TaxID=1266600 RepID=A0A2T0VBZ2_9MICO|nr:DeoR/GlpR family DNA-binding transcription regulator [Glaciihabitans tibetensis]PRY67671.1 DeoR family transcriptional regulator [Glaciihabitans tibetensis]
MARDSTAERREKLADLVTKRGFLRVADASAILGVSEVTVRADLTALEATDRVLRVHGGAMPVHGGAMPVPGAGVGTATSHDPKSDAVPEPTFEQALIRETESKRAIGEAAAALVTSGQSVILDVGSTALAVAEALVRRVDLVDVAVITNGISIALALEAAIPRFTVVVTGGTLRPLQHSLVNPSASAFLESVHVDIAFIGCNGIDPVRGVTNINYPEAEVKRRMVQSSSRQVLIADGSKLGQAHLGVIGAVAEFAQLVTGGVVDEVIVDSLRSAGLEVLVVA